MTDEREPKTMVNVPGTGKIEVLDVTITDSSGTTIYEGTPLPEGESGMVLSWDEHGVFKLDPDVST